MFLCLATLFHSSPFKGVSPANNSRTVHKLEKPLIRMADDLQYAAYKGTKRATDESLPAIFPDDRNKPMRSWKCISFIHDFRNFWPYIFNLCNSFCFETQLRSFWTCNKTDAVTDPYRFISDWPSATPHIWNPNWLAFQTCICQLGWIRLAWPWYWSD